MIRRRFNPLDETLRRLEKRYLADPDPNVYAKILAERIRTGISVDEGVPPSEVDSYALLIKARIRTGVTTQPRVVMAARLEHEAARLAAPEWTGLANVVVSDEIWGVRGFNRYRAIETIKDNRYIVAFACDCAKLVLPVFELEMPGDMRPRLAIEAAIEWITSPSNMTQDIALTRARSSEQAYEDATDNTSAYAAGAAASCAYAAYRDPVPVIDMVNNAYVCADEAATSAQRLRLCARLAQYLLGEVTLPPLVNEASNETS